MAENVQFVRAVASTILNFSWLTLHIIVWKKCIMSSRHISILADATVLWLTSHIYYRECFADTILLIVWCFFSWFCCVSKDCSRDVSWIQMCISLGLASMSGAHQSWLYTSSVKHFHSNKDTFSRLNSITEFHLKVALFWNESRDTSSSSRCVFLPPCRAGPSVCTRKRGMVPIVFLAF